MKNEVNKLQVVTEFGIPSKYHHRKIPREVLRDFELDPESHHMVAMTEVHGRRIERCWNVVATSALVKGEKKGVTFGEILLPPDTQRENVLPITGVWIRESKATLWMPRPIKPQSLE